MGMVDNISIPRKLGLSFGVMLAVGLGVNGVVYWKSSEIRQAVNWSDHTIQVIDATNHALAGMVDQETGYRGFLLSGDSKFLGPYQRGWDGFDANWRQAKALTADNPAQQERLDAIHRLAEAWHVGVAEKGIALMAHAETREAARQTEIAGAGKEAMDGLRAKVAEVIGTENALMQTRRTAQNAAFETTTQMILLGILANLLIAAGIAVLLIRTVARPVTGSAASSPNWRTRSRPAGATRSGRSRDRARGRAGVPGHLRGAGGGLDRRLLQAAVEGLRGLEQRGAGQPPGDDREPAGDRRRRDRDRRR